MYEKCKNLHQALESEINWKGIWKKIMLRIQLEGLQQSFFCLIFSYSLSSGFQIWFCFYFMLKINWDILPFFFFLKIAIFCVDFVKKKDL